MNTLIPHPLTQPDNQQTVSRSVSQLLRYSPTYPSTFPSLTLFLPSPPSCYLHLPLTPDILLCLTITFRELQRRCVGVASSNLHLYRPDASVCGLCVLAQVSTERERERERERDGGMVTSPLPCAPFSVILCYTRLSISRVLFLTQHNTTNPFTLAFQSALL